jgi:NAD(P)-dependent dehydrogenase (short-subunit alcohol dehydrogenase family)
MRCSLAVAALEYAGSGVTINCINPGWVLTDLVRKYAPFLKP